MELLTLDNGIMINNMDTDMRNGQTEQNTKEAMSKE